MLSIIEKEGVVRKCMVLVAFWVLFWRENTSINRQISAERGWWCGDKPFSYARLAGINRAV